MSLEIGDKVKLNPLSEWNDGNWCNPLRTSGEVLGVCKIFPILVKWENGCENGYFNEDLIKQEDVQPFPDFLFKLRNGDKPEVRQWLKDNGVVWSDGDDVVEVIKSTSTDGTHLAVMEDLGLSTFTEDFYSNNVDIPEIQLEIQPAKVIGYSLVDKKSEKELQLEEIIAKLASQLNEAQTELKSIK